MSELKVKIQDERLTPGQMLNQARTARNLTEADVAQQLLLSKQIIVALENDDYSKIVAPVYAKGYLKAYANFLQLPVEKILAGFDALNAYPNEEVFNDLGAKHIPEPSDNVITKLPLRKLAYLVFALVVIILVVLIATHSAGTKKGEDDAVNNETTINLDMPVKTENGTKDKTVSSKAEKVSTDSKASSEEQSIALPGQKEKEQKKVDVKDEQGKKQDND